MYFRNNINVNPFVCVTTEINDNAETISHKS